jgi:hypothetical protein
MAVLGGGGVMNEVPLQDQCGHSKFNQLPCLVPEKVKLPVARVEPISAPPVWTRGHEIGEGWYTAVEQIWHI